MKILAIAIGAAVLFSGSPAWSQQVMTDKNKMTLYTFDKDTDGKSACNGTCAENWPPYTDGLEGAPASVPGRVDWTPITRDDGKKMWAYKGKPLYYFKNDTAPGDMKGDGLNGVWHVAKF